MIPAVSYLRMSTDAQEDSIAGQRVSVAEYAKKNGYRIIREYADAGISGDDTERRVEFQRMLKDAAKGDFKVVLCWNQDRFGRFDLLEAGRWIYPLRSAGVSLVTVTQGPIDWNDFAGRLIYSIEQEGKNKFLRDLSWNVNRGKYAKAKLGMWMGGPAPFGYELVATSTLGIKEPEAGTVRLIFELFANGMSLTAVAFELNRRGLRGPECDHWNRNAVTRVVDNVVYTGTVRWNRTSAARYSVVVNGTIVAKSGDGKEIINDPSMWLLVPNSHPAIVSQELFDAAQKSRGVNRSWGGRPATHPVIFRGILRCGRCGKSMHGEYVVPRGDVAFVCSTSATKRQCEANRTYQKELAPLIREYIKTELLNDDSWKDIRQLAIKALSAPKSSPIAAIQKANATLKAKLAKAESRLIEVPSDMVAVVAQQVRELRDQLDHNNQQLALAAVPQVDPIAKIDHEIAIMQARLRTTLDAFESPEINTMLREIIDRIEVISVKETTKTPQGKYVIESVTVYPKFPEILQ